jgi:plasmid stabilization system protein ParE
MAYTLKLAATAEADAYNAFEFIRAESPESAEEWLIELFRRIETLGDMPQRCMVIAESREIGREVRQLVYERYRILFDIQDEDIDEPVVRVLRIWHGARDVVRSSDVEVK